MNIVGLYGGTGFVGNYFQSMLRSSNDNTHVRLIPHRGSNKEIKEALKKLDTFGPEESNRSIIYLAENNVISEADINKKEYVKQNLDRLNFVLSNTNCKIIYASSVSVYGDLSLTPHHPNDKLIATNTYTYSKLECEKLVIKADGIIARLSNIYGPGMSRKNILSDLIKQISSKNINSVTIANGTPKRDLIHINDVTSCLLAMSKIQKKGVYNVATGTNISMKNLAIMILEAANITECKVEESQHSNATSCISLDISKTIETFKWTPSIRLKDGLRELV